MSQVKELKNDMIAGLAIKEFSFFIQWHLTERRNLQCRHCNQRRKRIPEMTLDQVKQELDGANEIIKAWERNTAFSSPH